MSTRRNLATLAAAAAAAVVTCSLTFAALAEDDPGTLRDGDYFGYVRRAGHLDPFVAVDFVGVADGSSVLVYAGPLTHVGLLDADPAPFRVTIEDGAIVALQSAD